MKTQILYFCNLENKSPFLLYDYHYNVFKLDLELFCKELNAEVSFSDRYLYVVCRSCCRHQCKLIFICRPFRKRVLTAMNIKVDGDWSINSSLELLSSGNSLIIYDRDTGTTFLSSPVHVCGLFTEIRYGYKIWRAWKSPDYFSFPGKRVDPVI